MEKTGMSWVQSFFDKNTPLDEEEGLATFFSYKDLKKATNNFKKVIGKGGYGTVYYGELRDKRIVAVKVLSERSEKSIEQFNNEVTLLSRLRHDNLVAFYGSTKPTDEKLLLVYEFVPNGTLAHHLYGQRVPLPLYSRVHIAIEMAEGLSFLHTSEPQIIHRDFKSENILLDDELRVKVADFGLCRLLPGDKKDVFTVTPGTMGYRDPAYEDVFMLTDKSDVYSFGVVLMELILRKPAVDVERPLDDIYLHKMVRNKELEQLVDRELGYDNDDAARKVIDSIVALAQRCMQSTGEVRPSMVEVLVNLKHIKRELRNLVFKGAKIAASVGPNIYTYKELEMATNKFSQLIGWGSFARVYQGKLKDGRLVAVKKYYDNDEWHLKRWSNEVDILSVSRYGHENLVILYGGTDPRVGPVMLVLELVPHGTLWDHLNEGWLTWSARIQIAIETAEGIAYLHIGEPLIIHLDISSDNILLDNAFHAKLSGFHLSRLLPLGTIQVVTKALGHVGYRDPEYETTMVLSEKSDVYSFGVVLAELITGKRAIDSNRDLADVYLFRMVENRILNNKLEELFDPTLGYETDIDVKRMVDGVAGLVRQCLQPRGKDRPLMVEVLKTLKGIKDGHT